MCQCVAHIIFVVVVLIVNNVQACNGIHKLCMCLVVSDSLVGGVFSHPFVACDSDGW